MLGKLEDLQKRLKSLNWPIAFSHLACLLLGTAAANIMLSGPDTSPKIPAKSVIIAVSAPKTLSYEFSVNEKVGIFRKKDDTSDSWCRIDANTYTLVTINPKLTVAVPFSSLFKIIGFASLLPHSLLTVFPQNAASTFSLCNFPPKVSYGSMQ